MRRLPPPPPASLPSAFLSFLAHAAVVVGGMMAIPALQPESVTSQMMYIPLELMTIDETTNMSAVLPTIDETEEDTEAADETEANPTPSSPPPDEDTVSFDEPKEKPPEPKKPDAKPAPAPSKDWQDDVQSLIDQALKDQPDKPQGKPSPAPEAAPDAAPRLSVGDRKRMTVNVVDAIKSQLLAKKCFADHSDMADAKRLRVTIRVWFGRNGKFSQPYQLISPAREPMGDLPLQTFLLHAKRALNMCNNLGWEVPDYYFSKLNAPYIDLEFLPQIGASQ